MFGAGGGGNDGAGLDTLPDMKEEEDEGEDASAGAGDGDALDYLPPEARHWLRQGWGEFAERERAAQAAGTDYFSRTRPDRKRAKRGKKTPIDRLDSDAGTR